MCGRSCRSQSPGRQGLSLCYHPTEISRCHLRRHKWWEIQDTAAARTPGSSRGDLDGGVKGQWPHREGVSQDLWSERSKDTVPHAVEPSMGRTRCSLSTPQHTHCLGKLKSLCTVSPHHSCPTWTGEVNAQLLTQQGKTRGKREKRWQKNSLS